MNNKYFIHIFDAETGETVVREMNAEEHSVMFETVWILDSESKPVGDE